MANSPKQNHDEPDRFGCHTLSESSSSASSVVPSSDSWQGISHELLDDEQSDAFNNAPTYPGMLSQHNFSTLSDPTIGDPMASALCSSFNSRDVSRSMNNLAMRSLPPQVARSTSQHSWTDADVQGLGRTIPMDLASSSLLVHAGDPIEMALSSDEAVVAYDLYDPMTWTATDGGTPPFMSELLSGLSLHRHHDSDREGHETPGEVANT